MNGRERHNVLTYETELFRPLRPACSYLFDALCSGFLDMYPVVWLLDHMTIVFLFFFLKKSLFFTVDAPVFIPNTIM